MAVLSLSFAGCGFLGIYHLGVVEALLQRGGKLLSSVKACTGASAGSLTAALLITAPNKLEDSKDFIYGFADEVRKQKFGALTPGYDFMLTLRKGLENILPPNAHEIAADRLYVSITHSRSRENRMVSRFTSRENLIKVLLASCFVPLYAGVTAFEYQGEKWIDGGFTNCLPVMAEGRTVTISPFSGLQDICPKHSGLSNLHINLAKMDVLVSMDNIARLNQALFPPAHNIMKEINRSGYEDALRFLRREKWMD
ncbi:patatin-like phospholipase domain-containing protein 4 isoform X1 [Brienomyrus brachyistius]|uniref:patatin-like phospholipase domain-containing protein 4 isoform X1 n=2 Tax=Brienomyrus brachyistius TaxID=42636 RepID=UPI0020B20DDC|nr:patatin-like phospholipase domain-containing protein 4 isoform X1 [Brienomyrus brachyistius]XP_048883585.1 patatin-like phospholipase domain-containing protein 4 isoform X1 [Brienomyrus brachyistius]XP_048883669.1 patatin-like phospholipase domain-containing protein 4 isoform X1 [Brienomyrus brachyistius]